jgi:signal peptidase I
MQMSVEVPAQQPVQQPARMAWERRILGWTRDILETLIPALLIVLVVNTLVAQATRVEGPSMEPTLHNNQRLIIEKVSLRTREPRRGEIVVFRLPNYGTPSLLDQARILLRSVLSGSRDSSTPDPLIKRVIGLPGETIEIRDGHVYVDGQLLVEEYLTQLTLRGMGPKTISAGHIFVLGDNRGASNDSRIFGEVAISSIIGRAWVRYWPLDKAGQLH